jgi:deazaflavin-dependent oxidoreductase (nitroreductase family)
MSTEQMVPQISMQYRGSNGTESSVTGASLESVADKQVLYLTTVGRRTGLPREIEIWFVVWCERLYLFAETREAAGWVKNIRRNPKVKVRIGEWRIDATARVPDPHTDRKLWDQVAAIANRKYGWGDGLPVEITPLRLGAPHSDARIELGAAR